MGFFRSMFSSLVYAIRYRLGPDLWARWQTISTFIDAIIVIPWITIRIITFSFSCKIFVFLLLAAIKYLQSKKKMSHYKQDLIFCPLTHNSNLIRHNWCVTNLHKATIYLQIKPKWCGVIKDLSPGYKTNGDYYAGSASRHINKIPDDCCYMWENNCCVVALINHCGSFFQEL